MSSDYQHDSQSPSQLINLGARQATTTSLKVAEAFGKRHANVIRAIRDLDFSKEFTELNFEFSEYEDSTGRRLPMYHITKNGLMCLVMGFRGDEANAIKERFIWAFDLMSGELNSTPHFTLNAAERYWLRDRQVRRSARDMRQWQDEGPILHKRAIHEQAGQQRLDL